VGRRLNVGCWRDVNEKPSHKDHNALQSLEIRKTRNREQPHIVWMGSIIIIITNYHHFVEVVSRERSSDVSTVPTGTSVLSLVYRVTI
jgi:hypothetical protein